MCTWVSVEDWRYCGCRTSEATPKPNCYCTRLIDLGHQMFEAYCGRPECRNPEKKTNPDKSYPDIMNPEQTDADKTNPDKTNPDESRTE
ncbi:hypothetical protein E4U41_002422 [Claviceps citrina]|nr:hypothetical protein E4U41_002422 [Claviceps citrina]